MDLHFASGSALYNIGVEAGSLLEPSEVTAKTKTAGEGGGAMGHSPESTITSLRVIYPSKEGDESSSSSSSSSGSSSSSSSSSGSSSTNKMRVVTAGSDSRIIFWEQVKLVTYFLNYLLPIYIIVEYLPI